VIRCYTWRIARFLLQPKLCINDRQHACSTTPFRRRVGVVVVVVASGVVVVASVSVSVVIASVSPLPLLRRCRSCRRRVGVAVAVVASVSRSLSSRRCRGRCRRVGVAVVVVASVPLHLTPDEETNLTLHPLALSSQFSSS
jgi:hypothetical protein